MTLTNNRDNKPFSGTVLVCGTSPCLIEDFEKAVELFPFAPVMAINNAVSFVRCDFLATLHPEIILELKKNAINKDFVTLSPFRDDRNYKHDDYEVDYWVEGCLTRATSSISGAMMAIKLGFDQVVLCGAPLSGGDGDLGHVSANKIRFGQYHKDSQGILKIQEHLIRDINDGRLDHTKVRSMSGFTKEVFGGL